MWRTLWLVLLLPGCSFLTNFDMPNCPPGSSGEDCSPCTSGTWDQQGSGLECVPWTPCGDDEVEVSPGSTTTDRTCVPADEANNPLPNNELNNPMVNNGPELMPCDPGFYRDQTDNLFECVACEVGTFSDEEDAETCTPWQECLPGQFIAEEGSATADRLCGMCPAGESGDGQTDSCTLIPFGNLSAGGQNVCGLSAEGEVYCWGSNHYGQGLMPAGPFTMISDGLHFVCGIRDEDSSIECVGDESTGILTPPGDATAKYIASGYRHACFINLEDRVECFGEDSEGQLSQMPGDITFLSLSSSNHTCGITTGQSVYCWGEDSHGQVSEAPTEGTFRFVSSGNDHACALRSNGSITCWGSDDFSQINDAPDGIFAQVVSGESASCARTEVGVVLCWGMDADGLLPPDLLFEEITMTGRHVCGLVDGQPHCWGADDFGQVQGVPSLEVVQAVQAGPEITCRLRSGAAGFLCASPHLDVFEIASNVAYEKLSLSERSRCAIVPGGELECRGDQPGVHAPPPGSFEDVAHGSTHACALTTTGDVQCWGEDGSAPAQVPGNLPAATSVVAGTRHSCALSTQGEVRCWGDPDAIVVQNASETGRYEFIASGEHAVCAIRRAQRVIECWGEGPVLQSPPHRALEVGVGDDFACAILQQGQGIQCWGDDSFGQVTHSPEGAFQSLNVGRHTACAIRENGTEVCWGQLQINPRQR